MLSRMRFGGESAPLAGVRRSLMKHVTGKARGIVYGLAQLSTTTLHTLIIAQTHLHGLTTICDLGTMKRKRSERDTGAPRVSSKQTRLESQHAEFPTTSDASLLSTTRTPPSPCCHHRAERCSRTSPTLPPHALSRTPYTAEASTQIDFAALAASATTKAILACLSRRRTCAPLYLLSLLRR